MLPKIGRIIVLVLLALMMLIPLYLLFVNAFKSEQDIRTAPFGIPWDRLSFDYLWGAITSPQYNVIAAYGVTTFFVVAVCTLTLIVTVPAAYVISRGVARRHRVLLVFLLAGLFIPSHVLVIPVIYVLKTLGLMGTRTFWVWERRYYCRERPSSMPSCAARSSIPTSSEP